MHITKLKAYGYFFACYFPTNCVPCLLPLALLPSCMMRPVSSDEVRWERSPRVLAGFNLAHGLCKVRVVSGKAIGDTPVWR